MAEEPSKTPDIPLNDNEELSDKHETYFAIYPVIFTVDTVLSFDVFKKTADNNYELFHTDGEAYTATVHEAIFESSISTLYIRDIDKRHYYNCLENFLLTIIDDPFIDSRTKAKISHELTTYIASLICEKPDMEKIIRYKNVIKSVTDYIINNKDAINNLISVTKTSCTDYNHLVNVGIYGMGLAKEILIKEKNINFPEIVAGFFLHDIGKVNVPQHITHKHGALTEKEWEIVKTHPEEGYNILKELNMLTEESEIIVLQHHERHDGKGYPKGLIGDQIHKYSKICSIADAFDALTSYRPFRKSKTSFDALKIMHVEMKNEFDPDFFGKFVLLFSRTNQLDKK